MRVTDSMTNSMLTGYLLKNRDELYDLERQSSSQKKVTNPSDDPGAYDLISKLHTANSQYEQFETNCDRLKGELLTMDAYLKDVNEQVARASELIISGGDGTKNVVDLQALGDELDQILESIVGTANSADNGSSLFGGLRQSELPYVLERNAEGQITSVTYQGGQETRMVEVSQGQYVPATLVGSSTDEQGGAFETSESNIFDDLILARDRLWNGENLAEPETCSVDAATSSLAVTDTYATGASVTLSADGGVLPQGLSDDTEYFVIKVSDTEIQLAASRADADAGIAIAFGDAGSGELQLTQTHIADIDRSADALMDARTRLGSYEERVTSAKTFVLNNQDQINQKLEDEESADLAKVIMELTNKQTAYEASMKVTSSMMQLTFLNYI